MKKFVLFISLFALSVLSVQARENKLYFTEENNRLYYESKLIDEDDNLKLEYTKEGLHISEEGYEV